MLAIYSHERVCNEHRNHAFPAAYTVVLKRFMLSLLHGETSINFGKDGEDKDKALTGLMPRPF